MQVVMVDEARGRRGDDATMLAGEGVQSEPGLIGKY